MKSALCVPYYIVIKQFRRELGTFFDGPISEGDGREGDKLYEL